MDREILIQTPNGQAKVVQLQGERMTLGRSSTCELCFPDDAGLSRQHLSFDRDGNEWMTQDLGSKNGTLLNNLPLKVKTRLKRGDRITAGHLSIIYDDPAAATAPATDQVVFVESSEGESPSTSTVMTSLEGALSEQTKAGATSASHVNALVRAGRELTGNRPLSELFKLILDLSIDAVGAQRGVILSQEGDRLVTRAHKGEGFRISSAVRDRVLSQKASVLIQDTQLDAAFRERLSIVEQKVRTFMAVPLQTKDQIIGLIYVDSPFAVRPFTKDDLNLLTVMANVAAVRIEHARLAEVEQMERIMARDLEQAADIQRRFLPAAAPEVPGADVAGYNAPCRTVGGDYYDFFTYPNGRVSLVLGDVSGKGMPASLMMMGLQARVQAMADDPGDVGAAITRLNKNTAANCPANRFITLFFCVMDPCTGDVEYCNAGHNPPSLVRADGSIEHLEGGGPVLGILKVFNYQSFHIEMNPGDVLVIYSDGVTEATNPDSEEFGEDRLDAILKEHRTAPASEIVIEVNKAVHAFAAGSPPADDVTLVVAKRTM